MTLIGRTREGRVEAGLLCLGLAILLTMVPPTIHSDGAARYDAVRALMRGEIPTLKYSLVQPLLNIPLVWAGQAVAIGSRTMVGHFNILLFVAFAYPIWRPLSRRFGSVIATRTLLLALSASMFPYHLAHYFGEVLSALSIGTAFLYARERPGWTVVLLAVGVANSPALLVPVGLCSLVLMRRAPALLIGTAAAAMVIGGDLYLKFGSLTSPYLTADERGFETILPYSGQPGFSYPIFLGVLSVLFSFGKGLVWFIPGLVTLFDRRVITRLQLAGSQEGRALALFCAAIVLVYSGWWAWYGGNFWGPRFFLILALPASLGLAAATVTVTSARRASIAIALVTLATWVGINGAVFDQQSMEICWQNNYEWEFLCWYVPEFSALWRPFVALSLPEWLEALWIAPARWFVLWQVVVWGYLAVAVGSRNRVSALAK